MLFGATAVCESVSSWICINIRASARVVVVTVVGMCWRGSWIWWGRCSARDDLFRFPMIEISTWVSVSCFEDTHCGYGFLAINTKSSSSNENRGVNRGAAITSVVYESATKVALL